MRNDRHNQSLLNRLESPETKSERQAHISSFEPVPSDRFRKGLVSRHPSGSNAEPLYQIVDGAGERRQFPIIDLGDVDFEPPAEGGHQVEKIHRIDVEGLAQIGPGSNSLAPVSGATRPSSSISTAVMSSGLIMTPVLQSPVDIGEEQGAAVTARPAAGPPGPGRYGRLVPRTGLRRPLVRHRRSAPAAFRRVRSARLDEPGSMTPSSKMSTSMAPF
jgi:hypothetical protein